MKISDAPKKQPVPFGVNGQREDLLPNTSVGDNTASYEQGFPPITMIPKLAGGVPPKGQDMNQILYELSNLSRWASAGMVNVFDPNFSSSIGGYPKGALVYGADAQTIFQSTIDNNNENPEDSSSKWVNLTSKFNEAADALRKELASTSGKPLVSPEKVKVSDSASLSDFITRMQTLADYGKAPSIYGFNSEADSVVYNNQAQQPSANRQVLHNGSINTASKFRGVRRNATSVSVRGGRASLSDGQDFAPQVVGVNSAEELSSYGLHDGVSSYGDATLPRLESWENVDTATYTSTSVSVDPVRYIDFLTGVRPGDIIKTKHATKAWGIVSSIEKSTGLITVDGWASGGTPVTPDNDGSGFNINAIDKVWAFNYNALVSPESYGSYAVIGELGLLNKKTGMGYANGMDCVLLPGSLANGTAAYLARSGADGYGWLYGYRSEGCRFNFYSVSGKLPPLAGHMESSNAVVGVKFKGENTYSQAWLANPNDLSSVNQKDLTAITGPQGHVFKCPERIIIVNSDLTLPLMYPTVYVATEGVSITMPNIEDLPTSGYLYKLRVFKAGTYNFKAYNNQTTVNGYANFTLTTMEDRKTLEIQFDGTYWQLFVL